MESNKERLFVWDGQTYTLYFEAGNQAITYDAPEIPVRVSGPLTAGVIPWGGGVFTLEKLTAAQGSATRTQADEGPQIEMAIHLDNQLDMQLVLVPDKNYAVRSCTLERPGTSKTVQTYGNFTLQGERWIPMNILVERFDTDGLIASDSWEITALQSQAVEKDAFKLSFKEKTRVEYHTPVLDKPAFYRHSSHMDTKSLLDKRIQADLKKNVQKQNCGSVAVGYILEKLGAEATDAELASLVNDGSKDTSLYQIRRLVQQKGLHSAAVKTDTATLSKLKDCQLLLHLPTKKHFVVLDRIEDKSVWLIDLDRQTFYHTMDLDAFRQEWAGIALVVSSQPLSVPDCIPVPDDVLRKIKGAADFSCTKLIHDYDVFLCPDMILGLCGGRYYMYYQRWACEPSNHAGDFCEGTDLIGHVYSPCAEDWYYPGTCNITGDFRVFYIRACEP
jgi:hypothetical protein